MIKYILLFLILSIQVFSQKPYGGILTEWNITPSNSSYSLAVSYKIPLDLLLFEKFQGSLYSSEFEVTFELADENDNVFRKIDPGTMIATGYQNTVRKDAFAEGVVEFSIAGGSYTLEAVFTDKLSKRTYKLEKREIEFEPEEKFSMSVLSVYPNEIECDSNMTYRLVNSGGSVSFDRKPDGLLLTVKKNTTVNSPVLKSDTKTVKPDLVEIGRGYYNITSCKGNVTAEFIADDNYRSYLLKDFTNELPQGKAELLDGEEKITEIKVGWLNKPRPLRDPVYAVRIMRYIESSEVVGSLLDYDREKLNEVLFDYWKKYDPTPETEYNELMEEYYQRVDYAIREFETLRRYDGDKTDRGRIYIVYGEPSDIERTTNERGNMVEIWRYNKLNKKFIFTDKTGTGNFILEK